MSEVSTPGILDKFLEPFKDCLTPEVAERIVGLRLDEHTQRRLDQLREKANEGQLSADERSEYEEYVEGIDLIGILKAKAKMALAKHSA